MTERRSRLRRASGAWLLAALVTGLTALPICDLHFDCGCTWLGRGGASHCDIHHEGPPDCPWCVRMELAIPCLLFAEGLGGWAAWSLAGRRGWPWTTVAAALAIWVGLLASGIAVSLLLGLTPLAGLR